jgi:hypothetical protein
MDDAEELRRKQAGVGWCYENFHLKIFFVSPKKSLAISVELCYNNNGSL